MNKVETSPDDLREQLARYLYFHPTVHSDGSDVVCYTGNIEYERCLDKADRILAIVRGEK